MSNAKFWTLNVAGGLCSLLIATCLVLGFLNERWGQSLTATQQELNNAQQVQTTFQNLAVRIAQAAQTETALADLMKRHDLKVNLNSEQTTKSKP